MTRTWTLPTKRGDSRKDKVACACVHFDRYECANIRYQRQSYDAGLSSHFEFDPCDCDCHDWDDDWEDELSDLVDDDE
jgi:hypothetical protein